MTLRPLVFVLLGCARTSLDQGSSDASVEPIPSCDPTHSFTTVGPLAELDTDSVEDAARLTDDELDVYFVSDRRGLDIAEIFTAHRSSRSLPFETPVVVPNLTHPNAGAAFPNVAPNLLDLVFEYGVCADVLAHMPTLCEASRPTAQSFFGAPHELTVGDTSSAPARFASNSLMVGAGRVLYFDGEVLPPTPTSIARATRPLAAGNFGAIERVPLVFSDGQTHWSGRPVTNDDERILFFSRDDLGTGANIWQATRPSTAAPYASSGAVSEVASALGEHASWLSQDGCRLYFTRNLPTEAGGVQSDIYVATR